MSEQEKLLKELRRQSESIGNLVVSINQMTQAIHALTEQNTLLLQAMADVDDDSDFDLISLKGLAAV